MRHSISSVALVFCVAVAACDCSGSLGEGEACTDDGMCASGLTCVSGVCARDGVGAECVTTADCAAGLECMVGACQVPPGDAGGGDSTTNSDVMTGCGEFDFSVNAETSDLMLVVDRSLSMDDDIPGTGRSKWDAMLAAVDSVTHALEAEIDFGMASFAGEGRNLCTAGDVLIDPDANTADAIVNRLTRDGTGGATPTAATIRNVTDYLQMPRAGHETHAPAILLATDGAPNCNDSLSADSCTCTTGGGGGGCMSAQFCLDDAETYAAIEAAASGTPAIPVYVIGLPGSEAFADVLSEMARRGGTARGSDPAYYEAGDETALESALSSIASGFVGCSFHMDVAPENPRRVRILLDGTEVMHTDSMTDGWAYTNADNTVFELFGAPCDTLTDGGTHTVTASYACEELF